MKKAARFLVLLLLSSGITCSSLSAQPGPRKGSKSTLKLAQEHVDFEEWPSAIPEIQQLLQSDPENAKYNFWMGKALFLTYKKNQALNYLSIVNRLDPNVDAEFHYYYGLTLHYNHEYDKAMAEYRLDLQRYQPGGAEYVQINNRIAQCLYAKKQQRRKEAEQVKITNMGDQINTEYSEHSPVISANDSVLIFTARRPDCLGADPKIYFYDEDLYISHRKNGEWQKATNIGAPVNTKGHDATISLSSEGSTLFMYRDERAGGLYVSNFDSNGQKWNKPHKLMRPFNSKYYEASVCLSADSSLMFFTSDRPGGFGGRDIYVSRRVGFNSWSEAKNLGSVVNTPFDEDAPYFHPDGKTLYYSSNGPASMGGFDIFVSEMDSNAAGGWLEALNMGWPINTPDDDIYFVLSSTGKNGYYSSGKEGGYGEKDIYNVEFPYFPYPRRYFIIELAGLLQDVRNLDTLQGVIKLVDKETGIVLDSVVTSPDSENYYFVLEPKRVYTLVGSSPGYRSVEEALLVPDVRGEDILIQKNLFLDKEVVAETTEVAQVDIPPVKFEVMNIYFDFDKTSLRSESLVELDKVAQLMRDNPSLELDVLGHTDWFGTYEYNVTLSMKRSQAAFDYLTKTKGIDPARIKTDHFSENTPMETNDNDDGRQYNRRVEFRFKQNSEMVLNSVKLRSGVEGVRVDHAKPKGLPGFDNPAGLRQGSGVPSGPGGHQEESADPFASGRLVVNPTNETGGRLDVNAGANNGKLNVNETVPSTPAPSGPLASLDLHHIYFDFDQADLRAASKTELDKLVVFLKANSGFLVEVYGHTDSQGSAAYNQALSERRATHAINYLIDQGVSRDQVVLTGYSEDKPLSTNESASGRQNNRRVEFRILQKSEVLLQSIP